ncbi:MAG TPA: uroporphyrinogen decarboxylase family protein [Tepidisphaeraceae bacterium]
MTEMLTDTLQEGALETDRLAHFDFKRHNEEVTWTWKAFNQGKPTRAPIIFGIATRYHMMSRDANPKGVTFQEYMENPDVMFEMVLQFQRWNRFNILQDVELGLPEKWSIVPDFQNFYETAWLGGKVEYLGDEVPDTHPPFEHDPERVMENGIPDPFDGIMHKGLQYYNHFKARAARETYLGRPIEVVPPWFGIGTDGPMTVACNLFNPTTACELILGEPERMQKLFSFITDATITRIKAWRKLTGVPIPQDGFGYADDSVALISADTYRECVLPHHRRMLDELATSKPRSIHLCGDSTRHFLILRDELNINSFDTGFPIDFGKMRKQLGPQVRMNGGPQIEFLRTANPATVRAEVARIVKTGVLEGGLFVLREGNNLAPHTPYENTEAMYAAGRELANYERNPELLNN